MSVPAALAAHYQQLLGLVNPWKITDINLDVAEQRLDNRLEWPRGRKAPCPECGKRCGLEDHLPERWSAKQRAQYRDIKREFGATRFSQSRIGRMWAARESFRPFWHYVSETWAAKYFRRWYFWATHSRIPELIRVAKMLKVHLDNILTYFRHGITNAFTEGMNSKIQEIKSAARGVKNFENYRIAILFYCDKLDMRTQS